MISDFIGFIPKKRKISVIYLTEVNNNGVLHNYAGKLFYLEEL